MREQQAVGTRAPDSGGDGDVPAATPAWDRLEQQIGWYERKSDQNQHWFKGLKIVQIVTAAAIPVAAAASAPAAVLGGGGALIVVLEGLQQLQQYQQNWTTYRSTCERLKHEQFRFLSRAGPYAAAADPESVLAARVEALVSEENAAWVSHRERAATSRGRPMSRKRATQPRCRTRRSSSATGARRPPPTPVASTTRWRPSSATRTCSWTSTSRRGSTSSTGSRTRLGLPRADRGHGPALGDGHRRGRVGPDRRRRGLRPARGRNGAAASGRDRDPGPGCEREMPDGDDLPTDVRPLTRRNALELSDGRWRYDIGG